MQISKPIVLATIAVSLLGAVGLTYSQSGRSTDSSATTTSPNSNSVGNTDPARTNNSSDTGNTGNTARDSSRMGGDRTMSNDSSRMSTDSAAANSDGSTGSSTSQDSFGNNRMRGEQVARADRH